ncbi:hypothetical protein ROZALSC1DRAFT_26434 [Rozella allomycis CSF55]|uniref:Peptidase S9 prolyl oligopeptidase catalytic domain-containing protein n=1 Tax=Rozella allomycis (strain CSF55) TaxID=988480 RepID=A0A075AMU2_ROZAC|nr:hypothetical protein O9G_001485 [Rozella allomycis CSF55]RKP22191.1 hypothetical protein ROZALSC1DRAFT_26434 [Rozella allomycis CSF55]|eukprot:EPZ31011.1 hypothetical protein O9G_001485 [Rozella allomycis CSF55]
MNLIEMTRGIRWHSPVTKLLNHSHQLPMKVDIICGERDWIDLNYVSNELRESMHQHKIDANFFVIPGKGHHGYCQNPEAFNDIIRDRKGVELSDFYVYKWLNTKRSSFKRSLASLT